jgi:RNase H-fold protein (predicted Holliday junction resolvase)
MQKMSSPYLALDLGFSRTGVALSESGIVAQPLGVITVTPPHRAELLGKVCGYVAEYAIQTLVLGIPLTRDDEDTEQSTRIQAVIDELESALHEKGLHPEMVLVNEFGSTREAAHKHPNLDDNAAAATLILQAYLDEQV